MTTRKAGFGVLGGEAGFGMGEGAFAEIEFAGVAAVAFDAGEVGGGEGEGGEGELEGFVVVVAHGDLAEELGDAALDGVEVFGVGEMGTEEFGVGAAGEGAALGVVVVAELFAAEGGGAALAAFGVDVAAADGIGHEGAPWRDFGRGGTHLSGGETAAEGGAPKSSGAG